MVHYNEGSLGIQSRVRVLRLWTYPPEWIMHDSQDGNILKHEQD